MDNPSLFFSNTSYDYLKDNKFIELLRNWNMYLQSNEKDDDVLAMWEELLLIDFRLYANIWLQKNKNKTAWRKELR